MRRFKRSWLKKKQKEVLTFEQLIDEAVEKGWEISAGPFGKVVLYPPVGSPFWDSAMSWRPVRYRGQILQIPTKLKEMLGRGNGEQKVETVGE